MPDQIPPQEGAAPAENAGQPRNDLGQFQPPAPAAPPAPQYDVPVEEAVSFYKGFHTPETREQALERTMRQYGYLPEGVPLAQASQVIQAYAQEAGNPLYGGMPQNQYPPQQGYQQEPPFLGYDQAGLPVYGQPQPYSQQTGYQQPYQPQPDPGIPVEQLRQGWQYDINQTAQQLREQLKSEVLNDIAMQNAQSAVHGTISEIAQRDGLDEAQASFLRQVAGNVMQSSQATLSPENARQVVQQTYDQMRGFRQAEVGRQVAGLQGAPQTQAHQGVPSGTPDEGLRGLAAATADAIAKIEADRIG